MKNKKITYLHGRPKAHPLHERFAQNLTKNFEYIDCKLRWQDKKKSVLFRISSWIYNAMYPPFIQETDVYLIDNLHFSPVIMKKLFRKRKKIIAHLGSHTLYFMKIGYFSKFNIILHKWALKNYDGLMFEGQMAHELAENMVGLEMPKHRVSFLGPPAERLDDLRNIDYNVSSNKIIVIANGPTAFRSFYKGMDIMCKAFDKFNNASKINFELFVLGDWSNEKIKNDFLKGINTSQRINFVGVQTDIMPYLKDCALCIHCTRGDAFPTSTIEAMTAGIPTIVSEWTGTKEIVEKVDSNFISKVDSNELVSKLDWFVSLKTEQKISYSKSFRRVTSNYTEENAVAHYKTSFSSLVAEIYSSK